MLRHIGIEKYIPKGTEVKMYKAITQLPVTCGSEIEPEKATKTKERKLLRKLYGQRNVEKKIKSKVIGSV